MTRDSNGSGETRVLFIHVMKTAGRSLWTNISRNFEEDELYPQAGIDLDGDTAEVQFRPFTMRYLQLLPEERRQKIRAYSGHFPLVACDVLGGDFSVITILREPVDRTISLLRHLRRRALADKGKPLEDIYEQADVFERLIHNHQTKIFSMTLDDDPTGYMQVIDVDGARLERAKANLDRIEFVGLTERYGDLVDDLSHHFGWRLARDARANVSPDHDEPVDEAFRERIAFDNMFDVELYEYAKDLVSRRRSGT